METHPPSNLKDAAELSFVFGERAYRFAGKLVVVNKLDDGISARLRWPLVRKQKLAAKLAPL